LFNAPEDVNITHNTISCPGCGLLVLDPYRADMAPGAGLVYQDNITHFGAGVNAQGVPGQVALDGAWKRIPDRGWVFDHNVMIGPFQQTGINKPSDYPAGNFWEETESGVGWTNASAEDYSLLSGSKYKGKGSDGRDPGIDAAILKSATSGTKSGGSPGPQPAKPSAPTSLRVE
ncbi:MAG TPA: hypothetical protein VLS90_11080, partial [Thermodesulfobacteriota bacterium]|nr:hypothetical protein [Thermodesulfobacteriota bacterium]